MKYIIIMKKLVRLQAAGLPIIGMIDGSAQEVIAEAKCGLCVNAGDVDGFARVMKNFIENKEEYRDFGLNGRKYFKDNFNKRKLLDSIEKSIDNLIER